MAQLDGREYKNWEEYIQTKFPPDIFNVNTDSIESVTTYFITTKESLSKTRIYLELIDGIALRASFDNPESPVSIKEGQEERERAFLFDDFALNDAHLVFTDQYLNIPVYYGWTEKRTYYRNKVLRVELFYNNSKNQEHLFINTYYWTWHEKAGCLLLPIVLPAIWIESKIVNHKIKRGKEIKVEAKEITPMIRPTERL